MSVPARIRIESTGLGHDSRVFYIAEDGTETEISSCITGADLHLQVGEVNTVTLHAIVAGGSINAELEDLIINRLRPRRRSWRWWHPVEITHFGSRVREWLRA